MKALNISEEKQKEVKEIIETLVDMAEATGVSVYFKTEKGTSFAVSWKDGKKDTIVFEAKLDKQNNETNKKTN